jgi:hypothetical protein
MGIRDRLKKRIGRVQEAVKNIREEASHPGRPQPHMAQRNPMWGGNKDEAPAGVTPQSSVPDPHAGAQDEDDGDGEFWFLKEGDSEGWDQTNPTGGPVEREEAEKEG